MQKTKAIKAEKAQHVSFIKNLHHAEKLSITALSRWISAHMPGQKFAANLKVVPANVGTAGHPQQQPTSPCT